MPFLKRDEHGQIQAVFDDKEEEELEQVPLDNPEYQAFVAGVRSRELCGEELEKSLAESDANLIRILEDLVDVLINRSCITFTDFPLAAQVKLLKRQNLRSKRTNEESPLPDDEYDSWDDSDIQDDRIL